MIEGVLRDTVSQLRRAHHHRKLGRRFSVHQEIISKPREEYNTSTANLPSRDVGANGLNFRTGTFSQTQLDREWVVRSHMTLVCIQTGTVLGV